MMVVQFEGSLSVHLVLVEILFVSNDGERSTNSTKIRNNELSGTNLTSENLKRGNLRDMADALGPKRREERKSA